MKHKFLSIILITTSIILIINTSTLAEKPLKIGIILDAGHGGKENHAIAWDGSLEKDLNLDIVYKLEDIFSEQGAKIRLTRIAKNQTIPIIPRMELVKTLIEELKVKNKIKQIYVICVHHNGYDGIKNGTEVYYRRPWVERKGKGIAEEKDLAQKIVNCLSGIGWKNNGAITDDNMWCGGSGILRTVALNRKGSEILGTYPEICYIDNQHDWNIYKEKWDDIPRYIALGVLQKHTELDGVPQNTVLVSNVDPPDFSTVTGMKPTISATITSSGELINRQRVYMSLDDSQVSTLTFFPNVESSVQFNISYTPQVNLRWGKHKVDVVVFNLAGEKIGYLNWEFTLEPGKPVIFKTYPHGDFPRFVDYPKRTDWYAVPYRFNIGIPSDCTPDSIQLSMTLDETQLGLSALIYRGETTTVPGYKGVRVPVYTASFSGPTTWFMDEKQYDVRVYVKDKKYNLSNEKTWGDFWVENCYLRVEKEVDYIRPWLEQVPSDPGDTRKKYWSRGGRKGYSFYGSADWYLNFVGNENSAWVYYRTRWGRPLQGGIYDLEFVNDHTSYLGEGILMGNWPSVRSRNWGEWFSHDPTYRYVGKDDLPIPRDQSNYAFIIVNPVLMLLFPDSKDGVVPYVDSHQIDGRIGEYW